MTEEETEFDKQQKHVDLVEKAYTQEFKLGHFTPTYTDLKKRTGLSIKEIKEVQSKYNFNPKQSNLRFFVPGVLNTALGMIFDEDLRSSARIKAIETYLKVFNSDPELMTGNDFNINVITQDFKEIEKHVEIRHAEVKALQEEDIHG